MKKRLSSGLLALCMMLTLLPVSAFAEGGTIIASGECGAQGDNLTWTLDSEGTLTISGEGMMGNEGSVPWTKSDIKKVVIEDGVTSIGKYAFSHCSGLKSVTLSANLTSIEESTFSECTSLTNIKIPSKVTSLGRSSFWYCTSLSSVELTDGLVSIGQLAFYNCRSLRDINIPQTVTTIENEAFRHCVSLTSVTIPSGVTNLGQSVFLDCDGLVSATIEEGVTAISYGTFEGCSKLSNVSIPSSVTTIGYAAFGLCSSLTSITIPSGVKNIDDIPFYLCEGLKEIVVAEDNTAYTAVDGVLFTKDLKTLVAYPIGNTRTTYAIPDGVNKIKLGAFIYCTSLASMSVPISVTTVECDATSDCYNLKDIYYAGTKEDWARIQFLDHPTGDHFSSDVMRSATIHYGTCALTFVANGGSGTMKNVLVEKGKNYTLPACGFTAPAGKEFKAWQIGGQEYAPGSTYTVTANTTVTAVWQTIPPVEYTLTGTITGHKGVIYTSVTAQLVGLNGSTYSAEVGAGVVDKTGKTEYAYTVSAPAGQYNLEVEARTNEGGVVNRTAVVKLTGNGQTKDVNLPNGQAKVKVENETGTAAFVGSLDELIIDADGEVNGEAAMTIRNVENSDPGVLAIRNAAPGQTLEFMELSISKTVDGTTTEVADTGDVTIEIVLAFDRTGKSNIAVYRYHDGSVDTLTTQASNNGEKYEVDDESIAIYAKKFSVYAIGYTTAITNPTTPSRPSSSSGSDGGSSSPNYSITTPTRITGGTVKVNPTSASEGQRVTITVKPNVGYELDILTVTDGKGNILTVTDQGDGKYTFTMPKSKVSIDVSFKAIGSATQINFTDVQSSAYYYDAVVWAVENGVTFGITDTAFGPDTACTRAQIVSFLWRQAGSPKMSGTNPFTDVSSTDYYYDAVLWAVENGITFGSTDTTFSPGTTCTRAQAMTFLYRGKKSPAVSGTGGFTDVSTDAYYTDAVQWAVANGVTYGTTATTFSPDQACTRAQIVTFIYNAREK